MKIQKKVFYKLNYSIKRKMAINTKRMKVITTYMFMIFALFGLQAQADNEVKIQYLGHASFILQFDNGISVLTDYGTSNCYGLPSPIYDIGEFVPDIITYSHRHQDHYNLNRQPAGVEHILEETDSLDIEGLSIRPVRVCESDVNIESSTAFIFTYKGLSICHLSDAQANIMAIADSAQQDHIKEIFPDQFDLLFMTIEGVSQFIPEAELFVDLLQPKSIIPIHYWSVEYKNQFLGYLEEQDTSAEKNYQIIESDSSKWSLSVSDTNITPVRVISLSPAEHASGIEKELSQPENLLLHYSSPNLFHESTNIAFYLPKREKVSLSIYNVYGQKIETLVNEELNAGEHIYQWNAVKYPCGIYLYRFNTPGFSSCGKILLLK